MLWGAHIGSLELRTEGGETRLRATFPYGRETVLAEGIGRRGERREVIAARAFADRIDGGEDIHFLAGHDFNKPLASRSAGTLTLSETDDALTVDAQISADMAQVSYVRDFLSAHAAGLVRGLSPGFRVRPGGETVEERGKAVLRTIRAADLIEISAVTKPAYPAAQIEARDWATTPEVRRINLAYNNLSRWR
ncbi:HK97 family phage prohead protease [Antarctobacter sp.]|uniref:HK97 family phage prohead protease n=1 Tax=Antarctobacter sp. TaxID=1872577 RepID=UPI003A94D949